MCGLSYSFLLIDDEAAKMQSLFITWFYLNMYNNIVLLWQVAYFIVSFYDIRHTPTLYCQVMLTKHIMYSFCRIFLFFFRLKFFYNLCKAILQQKHVFKIYLTIYSLCAHVVVLVLCIKCLFLYTLYNNVYVYMEKDQTAQEFIMTLEWDFGSTKAIIKDMQELYFCSYVEINILKTRPNG